MRTLYESILDDIDIQMETGEDAVVNELINNPNKSKLWNIFDLSRHDVGRKYPLKFENKSLYIPRSLVQNIGAMQPLDVALGTDVDNLVIGGGLYIIFRPNTYVAEFARDADISAMVGREFAEKFLCSVPIEILAKKYLDACEIVGHTKSILDK